jgi:hypothetical protein
MSKKVVLTIRATNGTPWETDDFGLNQQVGHVLRTAIRHFVDEGVMTDGDYLLALVAGGNATPLVDSAKLEEAGVQEGSVVAILVRGPQVDGGW